MSAGKPVANLPDLLIQRTGIRGQGQPKRVDGAGLFDLHHLRHHLLDFFFHDGGDFFLDLDNLRDDLFDLFFDDLRNDLGAATQCGGPGNKGATLQQLTTR